MELRRALGKRPQVAKNKAYSPVTWQNTALLFSMLVSIQTETTKTLSPNNSFDPITIHLNVTGCWCFFWHWGLKVGTILKPQLLLWSHEQTLMFNGSVIIYIWYVGDMTKILYCNRSNFYLTLLWKYIFTIVIWLEMRSLWYAYFWHHWNGTILVTNATWNSCSPDMHNTHRE